jgi:nicotinic acid mononucleotide adenylyltransferase
MARQVMDGRKADDRMGRQTMQVPYGYEPPRETIRGTLFVYDSFNDFGDSDLTAIAEWAERNDFARIVLYPLHEATMRRMRIPEEQPYHRRVRALEEAIEALAVPVPVQIDQWENKRKKYTPIDTALDTLTRHYAGPHFLCLTGEVANLFAAFSSFEGWIRKLRLVIRAEPGFAAHPRLAAWDGRWELLGES